MQELVTCHWFCQLCNTKLGKIIPTIVRLSDRVTEVDNKRVTSVEKKISVCCDKVQKVTEDVNKRVSDADSHVVKIERDMKVMNGHITTMKEDMTKDLQKLATDVNKVKEEVDKKLTSNQKDINDISLKISDIFGEQADNWSVVVKKEVNKSLETVASNIQDVHKTLMETRAQAAEQREKENRTTRERK